MGNMKTDIQTTYCLTPSHHFQQTHGDQKIMSFKLPQFKSNKVTTMNESKKKTIFPEMNQEQKVDMMERNNFRSQIKKIKIQHKPINDDEVSRFLSQIKNESSDWKLSSVVELEFRDCDLTPGSISIFIDNLDEDTKVGTLNVTGTTKVDVLITKIYELVEKFGTEYLNLEENETEPDFLKDLWRLLSKHKDNTLRGLDLSYNEHLDFDSLGKIINSSELLQLKLVGCGLDTNMLENLQGTVTQEQSQVNDLDVSYNIDLISEDIIMLPSILGNGPILKLTMCGCDLSEDDVEGFKDPVYDNLEVEFLDVSYNSSLGPDGVSIVGESVKRMKCKNLGLSGCSLDEECVDSLRTSLCDHKLKQLDISDNPELGRCVGKVVSLVKETEIKSLKLSDCQITSKQVLSLSEELKKQKVVLEELNLSDMRSRPGTDYMSSLGKLLNSVEKKLIICFPQSSTDILRNYIQGILKTEDKNLSIVYEYDQGHKEKEIGCMKISC
uniref:uncharacterized protein LOC120345001 isoform X1 n=2 Tax=Styela clava TaxID=7725 RepID=UPI0019393CCD|nr:uncharacterized protein LOC120345001 isoform X1 [Styela clava]XP_039270295.1 uncharacterized protein LOC120345001 isoform X1 [Styela clava]XP_039270296.1 uncharacterized protein LOC120345001 isoform X1 [Styela clava]